MSRRPSPRGAMSPTPPVSTWVSPARTEMSGGAGASFSTHLRAVPPTVSAGQEPPRAWVAQSPFTQLLLGSSECCVLSIASATGDSKPSVYVRDSTTPSESPRLRSACGSSLSWPSPEGLEGSPWAVLAWGAKGSWKGSTGPLVTHGTAGG